MIFPRLPSASRQTAFVLVWLLLCARTAPARDFSIQSLSDPQGNSRSPSIGETGLVAWQGYSVHGDGSALSARSDVLNSPPGASRSDVFIWREGQSPQNITKDNLLIYGRSERPLVVRDSVIFTAWFKNNTDGGYPFELTVPPKNDEMRQMESEYPGLFDPTLPAPRSAVEADAATGDSTNPPPPDLTIADVDLNATNSYQRQMWRSSGKAGDIAVYRPEGGITRISPGTRHFSIPVMSDAGIAFQCARGWPYGYEILIWKPGDTNLTQLTTNYFYVLNPDIHDNELVFQAWDGDDYEIFRYRFDVGQLEQITNNQFDDTAPVVWNGEIAWVAHPTVTAEIFHWREGVIRKISEGTEDNGAPSIWAGKVVWQGYDDTDIEIYYFDGRRTIKLTSNTWDDIAPKIRDGLIAWMSYVDNWDSEIMALDLGDNIAMQLTDNELEDSFPQTAGEKIVWQTIGSTNSIVQLAVPAASRERPVN